MVAAASESWVLAIANVLPLRWGSLSRLASVPIPKQRTAIRMGPAGLSQGFREMAAACPK
jgi:hypothetical protein